MLKILIADDNMVEREMLRMLFEKEDYITVIDEAEDGINAEEKILTCRPDIVLVSLDIPKVDAIHLKEKIDDALKDKAPYFVIIYSGSVKKPLDLSSYYFMKPYNGDELLLIISKLSKENVSDENAEEQRERISEIVIAYGVTERLKGYDYILMAIETVLLENNLSAGISKQLYYTIARKFGKSYSSVERSIRYAIKKGFEAESASLPEELKILKEKRHKNFEFIVSVASYIRANKPS